MIRRSSGPPHGMPRRSLQQVSPAPLGPTIFRTCHLDSSGIASDHVIVVCDPWLFLWLGTTAGLSSLLLAYSLAVHGASDHINPSAPWHFMSHNAHQGSSQRAHEAYGKQLPGHVVGTSLSSMILSCLRLKIAISCTPGHWHWQ